MLGEEELAAQQADALSAGLRRRLCFRRRANVGQHLDALPIIGAASTETPLGGARACLSSRGRLLSAGGLCMLQLDCCRLEDDDPLRAVHEERLACHRRLEQRRSKPAHRRNAQRSRQDGGVRRRAAAGQCNRYHLVGAYLGGIGGRKIFGDDDDRYAGPLDQLEQGRLAIALWPQPHDCPLRGVAHVRSARLPEWPRHGRQQRGLFLRGLAERRLGGISFALDQLAGPLGNRRVFEHQGLRVEDASLRVTDLGRRAPRKIA